jgi:hypothetical protein
LLARCTSSVRTWWGCPTARPSHSNWPPPRRPVCTP